VDPVVGDQTDPIHFRKWYGLAILMNKSSLPYWKTLEQHPTIILGVVLFLGLILRLVSISSRGIWYDDAFSILLSRQDFSTIIKGTAADTMPPLSYFLLHLWMVFGQSIWFTRLLNIILSIFVIYLAYRFGRDLSGVKAGLLSAVLVAVSPLQIYHAQEIRMYILLELGCLGYLWMTWRISQCIGKPMQNWTALTLFSLLAVYSHNLAIFTLFVADAYLLLRRDWKHLIRLIGSQIVLVMGFLPWLLIVPNQIDKIQTAFWTPRPGFLEIIQSILQLLGSLPQPVWITVITSVLILQTVVIIGLQIWRQRSSNQVQFLLLAFLLPPVLLFVASYLMRPVYVPRAFITSGIGFYLLAGYFAALTREGNGKSGQKGISLLNVGVLILISLLSLPAQYQYDRFPRSPFKELGIELQNRCPPSSCLVLHDNKLSFFPMHIYHPGLNQRYVADQAGSFNDTLAPQSQEAIGLLASPDPISAVNGYKNIFFVTFSKALVEYEQMGKPVHPYLATLEADYTLHDTWSTGDLVTFELVQ
jgi:hypothetical protein